MLTIQTIRENRDRVIELLKIKNFDQPELIDNILEADNDRRSLQVRTNEMQAELNRLSKEIGVLFKRGEKEKAGEVRQRTSLLKNETEASEAELLEVSSRLNEWLVQLPNLPHPSVPPGKSERDNKIIRQGGTDTFHHLYARFLYVPFYARAGSIDTSAGGLGNFRPDSITCY